MKKATHWPGAWEGTQAVRFNFGEAWTYVPEATSWCPAGWTRLDMMSALYSTSILSEQEFEQLFPECCRLELPAEAFAPVPPASIEHRDRIGPLDPESWCSDPTALKD